MTEQYSPEQAQYGFAVLPFRHITGWSYAWPMTFGHRLAKLRKERKMTQTELGRGLGTGGVDVGKQVVHGWESGAHFPRVDQLILICEKLDCSADFLVMGETSVKLKVAKQAVRELDDTERLELLMAIQGEPVADSKVAAHYPPAPERDAALYKDLVNEAKPKHVRKKSA